MSKRRRRRRGEVIGSGLDRLESRTMLSVTSTPIMGPPPVPAPQALNLVLQPATGGALGSLAGVIASAGATVQATGIPDFYQVYGPAGVMGPLAAELAANPSVQYAAAPKTFSVADAPNDPSYLNNTQWYLDGTWGINAPGAWSVTTGSSQVIVADTDTGIAYNQPELVNNLWLNQAEIPSSVRPNLTDINGDGLITFTDLNNAVNQGPGKITATNGVVNGSSVLASSSSGGWSNGSTQDGDTAHPSDLIGWNFAAGTNDPSDGNGHGTFTAGEIAAVGNNGAGVTGALWSVQIMAAQFLDSTGNGSDSAAAAAIEYAVNHGARVINASWGAAGVDPVVAAAIQYADQYGVIIVAAAGNNSANDDNSSTFFAPASYSVDYPNMISVAATDINGKLASWSNYGVQSVQLAAPGVNLYGLSRTGYTSDSGTSMAAPLVTGTVALVQAAHPTWSMSQVIDAVLDTTTPDSRLVGKVATGGIVNAAAAVANTNGPYVVASTPSGSIGGGSGLSTIQVTFNEEVNPATFTPSQVTLTGPNGTISGVSVIAVAGSNDHTFAITFPSQSAAGAFTLNVGPDVQDWYGNAMNQNRNGTNGEGADAFTETINRAAGGSADVLLVTGVPSVATAGTSYSFTVTAIAPGGGTDTGFVGTVDFSSSDPHVAGLPASYTFTTANKGTAGFHVTLKTAGTQSITATEPSAPAVTGSEANILVNPAAAKTLVVTASGTATAGVPFAFTVTAMDAYGNVATGYGGTVGLTSTDTAAQFPVTYNGSVPAAPVPATYAVAPEQQGTGTFSVTFETPGTQSLTATDKTTSTITGTASGISVQNGPGVTGHPDATATTFASPVGSTVSGQGVTLTATVKATGSGIADPTDGSVSFYQGATLLGTVDLSGSNQATYSAGSFTPGTYTFFAAYNGDTATYQPSASPAFSQAVDDFATNLTLSTSLGSANVGQPLTFTATVTVAAPSGITPPAPTGIVTFYDGTTALSTVGLNASNQATLTTSALVPGAHAIVAVYNGDSLTQTNQSAPLTETVTATSQSAVYVNSAWAGDASGTQVTVGTTTHTIGTDAFATVQAGVAGAAAGGTVNVLAGTYSEQVTIGQSLTLAGAGASSTTLNVPSGASGGAQIAILGNPAVTISGLTLAGSPLLTGIADDSGGTLSATGVAISGDDVGISVEGGSTATITGSSITADFTGIRVANAGTATVTQSAITGCTTGILLGNGGGDVSVLTAQDDNFSGDAMGVQDLQDPTIFNQSPAAVTLDWWGSLTGPTSASNPGGTGTPISGDVGATPWIGVYTDSTPSGQPGFDPTSITEYAVPTQLVFTAEPSASAIEGRKLAAQPAVTAEDASGNLGINFNGSIALTLNATSGSGTLAGTSQATAAAGVATFSGLSITEPGTYTLTAAASTSSWTGLTVATSSPSTTVADGTLADTTSTQSYIATAGHSISSSNGNAPVILATFTDANPHATASDYQVSVTWGGSATATSDSVQLVSTTSTSSSWQVVGDATFPAGGQFTVSVAVTDADLSTNTFTDTHTTIKVAGSGSTAKLIGTDLVTRGNWVGTYGAQGYDALGYSANLPSYATVTPANNTYYTWASSTNDTRALQNLANPAGSRVAACWYSTHNSASFTIDVNVTDGQSHNLALYLLDWPNSGRAETVQLSDANTGTVLDTESVSSFGQGVYLQWTISGNVLITITKTAGSSAVLSGLFFDPPPAQPPQATASFVGENAPATNSGNWVGTYGTQGYDALGYSANLPSYATITPANNTYYTWASSTNDTRALQNPANPTGSRVAACWYSTHNTASFTIDVNVTDGQSHNLALYLLDWPNSGRSETVQLSDANTGTVLDTESVSSFGKGVYLQWTISGNVLITITKTAGSSAVLSGLFFDPPPSSPAQATALLLGNGPAARENAIVSHAAQDYEVVNNAASMTGYATVTPSGQTAYTRTSTSTDPRAIPFGTVGGLPAVATTSPGVQVASVMGTLEFSDENSLADPSRDGSASGRGAVVRIRWRS